MAHVQCSLYEIPRGKRVVPARVDYRRGLLPGLHTVECCHYIFQRDGFINHDCCDLEQSLHQHLKFFLPGFKNPNNYKYLTSVPLRPGRLWAEKKGLPATSRHDSRQKPSLQYCAKRLKS